MFHRDRACPICHGNSHIQVNIVGSSRKALPVPVTECSKCDYTVYFLGIGLLSYFGNAALGLLILLMYLIMYDPAMPLLIVAISALWIVVLPFIWLGLFVKVDLFSVYIDRKIIAWMRKNDEIERIGQLIRKDENMRMSILRRFIAVLSVLTIVCALLTAVLILRITVLDPGRILDFCLLLVMSIPYLAVYWEWKEKWPAWRKKGYFMYRGLYFFLKVAAATEAMVAVYAILLFFV